MFIQTEDTPNPATMKFLPSRLVVERPVEIEDASRAFLSPLAQALFEIEGVQSLFLGRDFISVTKADGEDWLTLRPEILAVIMDHFVSGRPVLNEAEAEGEAQEASGCGCACGGDCDCSCGDVESQIRELLEVRIRPALAQDGGDVAFEKYEDGVVYVRLKGACAGCPSATATLRNGIELMLKHFIPEVREVRRV